METPHVCPWWLGYFLASPLRRFGHNPRRILSPHVSDGMTVLEPGPGMGFFTMELARLVGPAGRVVAVDIEPRMLKALARRARRRGLINRIELRQAQSDRMGVEDLSGQVDFVLVFAVVHELPDAPGFFGEMFDSLKPGGRMLVSEPVGHVNQKEWGRTVERALAAGFQAVQDLDIRHSHSILLLKPNAKG
jgi:ubiquinone/menaquinone biosynthesis C-methylase UbiE